MGKRRITPELQLVMATPEAGREKTLINFLCVCVCHASDVVTNTPLVRVVFIQVTPRRVGYQLLGCQNQFIIELGYDSFAASFQLLHVCLLYNKFVCEGF